MPSSSKLCSNLGVVMPFGGSKKSRKLTLWGSNMQEVDECEEYGAVAQNSEEEDPPIQDVVRGPYP
eukprot:NODE_3631_length_352_cov_302.171617_g3549_i0.p2 GENE.NODE_3631_length_352_cov_302.171617_g3549_i0~~NODE_3631_length_352_cov_302.171617_g3549_i0.p2  ORF type:complete len:66 (+),score=21.81 NODE_3631_length_352_cov_302.171617_g3549_i0:82-279(+)